jgi:hypothetical protein
MNDKLEKLVDEMSEVEDDEYKSMMKDIVKFVEEYDKHEGEDDEYKSMMKDIVKVVEEYDKNSKEWKRKKVKLLEEIEKQKK